MSTQLSLAIWQFGLNALWVLLPLVPAILIYLIFPKTQLKMSGPFKGFSIRSTGAFAAYLIILLATLPLLYKLNAQYDRQYSPPRPTWTITGSVVVKDESGREINLTPGTQLQVSFDPNPVRLMNQRFRIIVPEIDDEVPLIQLDYPGFAGHYLDLRRPQTSENVRVDQEAREITITAPIVLQRRRCEGMGCG